MLEIGRVANTCFALPLVIPWCTHKWKKDWKLFLVETRAMVMALTIKTKLMLTDREAAFGAKNSYCIHLLLPILSEMARQCHSTASFQPLQRCMGKDAVCQVIHQHTATDLSQMVQISSQVICPTNAATEPIRGKRWAQSWRLGRDIHFFSLLNLW